MAWAREQTPSEPSPCVPYVSDCRRVRLEISAESIHFPEWGGDGPGQRNPIVMARVYLAEPFCKNKECRGWVGPCRECSPLAERRLQ